MLPPLPQKMLYGARSLLKSFTKVYAFVKFKNRPQGWATGTCQLTCDKQKQYSPQCCLKSRICFRC